MRSQGRRGDRACQEDRQTHQGQQAEGSGQHSGRHRAHHRQESRRFAGSHCLHQKDHHRFPVAIPELPRLMKNSIDASVEFSFKGEDYTYKTSIDLDQLLRDHDTLPSIHAILARLHSIDTYSYLYEVMQEAEIEFSNPHGLTADYLVDGKFD